MARWACSVTALFLYCIYLFTHVNCLPYVVHYLSGPTSIERDVPSAKQTVDIYCYTGTSKSLFTLWQTVKFQIKIKNDEFRQYMGKDAEEVYQAYTEDSYGWAMVNPFHNKAQKTTTLSLYEQTCMAVNTKERHVIDLLVQRVDLWRVLLMCLGIGVIFASRSLSSNPVFFYLCGIFVGVSASFMILVYYVSKLLPKKTLTYGILIGGWTVGVYVFQQIWENLRSLMLSYQTYMIWYTLIVSFVSFVVCYRIGPPRNERSKNLVMWTLQVVGVLMILFSSEYQEASAAVIITTLVAKYFPESWQYKILGYWRRKFPPKHNFLTNEEYYEEGARETKKALENLRKYCASPDCAQWNIMLKLNDSKRGVRDNINRTPSSVQALRRKTPGTSQNKARFASFVEGNSHLSDDEVLGYESYAFSMSRDEKRSPLANSTRNQLNISDDDDDDDDSDD